jgi:hypothetical protein
MPLPSRIDLGKGSSICPISKLPGSIRTNFIPNEFTYSLPVGIWPAKTPAVINNIKIADISNKFFIALSPKVFR